LARIVRLTPGYLRTFRRLRLERARPALGTIVKSLSQDDLPGGGDFETLIPPRLRAWVRRVPSFNLWLFYSFDATEVRVLMVTSSPPVPIDE
jgi:hypothetical protein